MKRLAVIGVFFGSPICGEYLQAYLPFTGNAVLLLVGLIVLAPLYGGAALLIREVAVRTGRGWRGIFLMAAAFGLLMPGVIDLAMWGEQRRDIAYWSELRLSTLVPSFGFSVFPMSSWVLGHVSMSICAPLAILEGLVPSLRGRPLLSWRGIAIVCVLLMISVGMIHSDARALYDYQPTLGRTISVTIVVAVLFLLALTRLGRPLSVGSDRWTPAWGLCYAVMFAAFLICELLSPSWLSLSILWMIVLTILGLSLWFSRSPDWGLRHTVALACGAIAARTVIGFLAPVPDGAGILGKYLQTLGLLTVVLAVTVLAIKRSKNYDAIHAHPMLFEPQ